MGKAKWTAVALFLASGGVLAAEDPSLLFVSDFDAYSVKARFGRGGVVPRGFGDESLQLRMWPGAYGSVNSLAYSKSETCAYPLKGNLDPRQGTVSFWVSSLGWKPSAKAFQWFVTARQKGFTLHVYKYLYPGHLYFYIDHPGKDGKVERLSCGAIIADKDWTEGKWHKLDAVWSETGMKLYVDGVLPKPDPKVSWLKPSRAFTEATVFPEAAAGGEIIVNSSPVKSGPGKDERTAIDDIRIWSRPLSDREIHDAYTAVVPSKFGAKRERCVLGIPPKAVDVALDGNVGEAEWADASAVPLADVCSFSKDRETALRGTVRVKRDAENLYVALTSNRPVRNRSVKDHDGPVWEDDSFELMFTRDGKTVYHLVVNAAGAVYDSATLSGMAIAAADCPELSREKAGGDPRVVVRVVMCSGGGAMSRHGASVAVKRIDVDVEWGPDGDRKCLNGLCGADIANYSHPVSVYKSPIDRGTLE